MTSSQYPQPPSQQPQYQPPPAYERPYTSAPPQKKFPLGKLIIVLIIVAIVVTAIAGIAFLSSVVSQRATLVVNVYNYNYYSIEYDLYVDGELEDSATLNAGYYMEYTLPKYPGEDCRTYEVSVTATGGGQTETDSDTVTLCPGETKAVDLHV